MKIKPGTSQVLGVEVVVELEEVTVVAGMVEVDVGTKTTITKRNCM